MNVFKGENQQTQYSDLGYRIDLYFHDCKLAIEVDEKGHMIEILTKALERELSCKFIRIDPDEEDFNIFKAINKIHRHIQTSTKKLTENRPKNL